jgi:Na+/H+-dicarboxylate symporter
MTPRGWSLVDVSRRLNRPSITLAAVAVALFLGIMKFPFLPQLRPIGDFYIALLQMCVLPFLLTTIPLAVRAAMRSGAVGRVVLVLAGAAALAIAAVAAASVLVPTLIFHFFDIDAATVARIGAFVGGSADRVDVEFALDPARAGAATIAPESGLLAVVPTNIFASLANNDSMRVLVFAAIFGIGLVMTERKSEESLFGALRHVQEVCILLFEWFGVLMPIGIVALIAPQVAAMGSEIFAVLAMFVYALLAVSALVLLGAMLTVAVALRRSPLTVFASMAKPIMMAAATRNSMICIPLSLETMRDDLRIARAPCELFIPVGIATLRFGAILYFIVATVFMGALLDRSFSALDLVLIALFSTTASFATIGANGLAALAPLAAVLRPFGLSYELAVPLMIIIDPIANMIRTMVNVAVNCAIPAVVGRPATPAATHARLPSSA